MLLKVLILMAKDGLFSKKEIAKKLKVDEGTIEQIFLNLLNMGYVEEEKLGCSGKCSGCGKISSSCSSLKTFKITSKGIKRIEAI